MAASRGTENIVRKLEKNVEEGNYYEAQQMYKGVFHRQLGQKKFSEARELLMSGISVMQKHAQYSCAAELSLLLVQQLLPASDAPVDKDTNDMLLSVFENFEEDEGPGRAQFMKAAIKWSVGNDKKSTGAPMLHTAFARWYWKLKDYPSAQRHFVRGDCPQDFAKMLIEWSAQGYRSEQDMFIARGVLQYLCLQNLKDANILFEEFMKASSLPPTPLTNFIRFLLLTLERDALTLFNVLREKYAPSIRRDPAFSPYLDHIASVFYNVRVPASGLQGILGDLLNNFLGDSSADSAETMPTRDANS
mmetsp:Transcript_16312/g.26937  ORF Transcript_16312/g.26937 Transcript_16312/m.26937 type:complete len:304 (+) Transcript_16312:1868-2779(+)